jgi:hypothetical protein
LLLGKVEIPEQKEKYFMRVTVRQLKGLIREAIDEAHDDMTGYEIDPGDDRGQLHNKGRSSKKMYLLTAGRVDRTIGLFSTESAAKAFARKYKLPNIFIKSVAVEPTKEEMERVIDSMQGGGEY